MVAYGTVMGALLKQYYWVVNVLAIMLSAYFAAKITNVYVGNWLEVNRSIAVIKPTGAGEDVIRYRPRADYEVIVTRNMFDSSERPADAVVEEGDGSAAPVNLTGEAVKTSLSIKLVAVLVVGEGKDRRSNAAIDEGGNGINVYVVGDEKSFSPGVRLVQIKPNRIEFVNNGRLEYAEMDDGMGANIFSPPTGDTSTVATKTAVPNKPVEAKSDAKIDKLGENKFAIDQKEIENALQNIDQLYTQIRAVPFFKDGKVAGMKILAIRPGSLFSKLGLERGDVLRSINGVELDIKRGFEIFSQLKDQRAFSLELIRGDANRTLDYEIR